MSAACPRDCPGWISPPGDIRAYDVVTGQRKWQFHTVPVPGEFGYDTMPPDAYKYVGGSNTWGEMSVDEALKYIISMGVVAPPAARGEQ